MTGGGQPAQPSQAPPAGQAQTTASGSSSCLGGATAVLAPGLAPTFHSRCGQLVTLSSGNRTASRTHATQEFNHGLVMSGSPLQDNQMFEVRIDKKINSWSGSIEVGVTSCDPNTLEIPFPSSATELREGSWIMSGNSILKDGRSINENYGTDLDKLEEADRVGVLKTTQGDLLFFVNGVSQGVAATLLPSRVFAVIDMYGKCAQVTLMDNSIQEARIHSNDMSNMATAAAAATTHLNTITGNNSHNNQHNQNIQAATAAAFAAVAAATSSGMALASASGLIRENSASAHLFNNNKIRFHERHGSLIKLSNNNRTAERKRPFDEFNNGVVMTHRPCRDNELFEIRLDRLVDKWSGSIEVGITTHNPAHLEFPATMTNLRGGTTMMSGCGILTNGKGTRREYGQFNLDELAEGDRIGMMRKANGNLHYYINGLDQGVAGSRLPAQLWGVVDLYGMTVKVTIVDRDERDEQNLITRRNLARRTTHSSLELGSIPDNRLLFHVACGSHAAVINGGATAHRPNAADDFNFGVVLTNRPLKPNEVFEVRLDKMVTKWAGSIEIGVTTHAPSDLEFPSTMTNVRSGTWMMTGNGVMHNGTTTIDDYGQNLDKLKVGDRVAVVRKESGVVHFFVNSEDQGPAATNVPERVYGVIDLYGQAAQATIVDLADFRSPDGLESTVTSATLYSQPDQVSDLRFHHLHGRNARISNAGITASRPNALGEFNDAIVMSARPLRDGEMFEIQIERMVERWSGSIEAGVTLIRPEDLEFPNTMTDIDYDTWMLSGSAVMRDGQTVRNGYCCDLDSLNVGSRLGMVRAIDGSLHYFINGEDQGIAIDHIPSSVYAVVDLYGICGQVSVVHTTAARGHQPIENSMTSSQVMESSQVSLPLVDTNHRFSPLAGNNVEVSASGLTAARRRNPNSALVFSAAPLENDEVFEVRIDSVDVVWSNSLKVGLSTFRVNDAEGSKTPSCMSTAGDCWWLDGTRVLKNNQLLKLNYGPSIDRLTIGDRVGIKRSGDGCMRLVVNGEDMGTAACSVPPAPHAVFHLAGQTTQLTVSSAARGPLSPGEESSHALQDSLENILEEKESNKMGLEFHENRGRNVTLLRGNSAARRSDSYNQGIVVSTMPLAKHTIFQVRITRLNPRWSASLAVGVIGLSPDRLHLPVSLLQLKKECWAVSGDGVYHNGVRVKGRYGPNLDSLQVNHTVGVAVDVENRLHLYVNGVDQGVAVKDIPEKCYAVVDLYGMCDEVVVVGNQCHQEAVEDYSESHKTVDKPTDKPADSDEVKDNKELKNSLTTSENELSSSLAGSKLLPELTIHQHLNVKNCEYLNLCSRFKSTLGLPQCLFSPVSSVLCYCDTCHQLRGEDATAVAGQPNKKYALPRGWCSFPLKQRHRGGDRPDEEREYWHIAFHGTNPGFVRKILDGGNLLTQGEYGLERRLGRGKSKEDDIDTPLLYFSPTVTYAGREEFAPPKKFTDPKSRRTYSAKTILMVEVQPGSYKVGPASLGGVKPEPGLPLEEREWVSKERGNTVLTALLVVIQS